MIGFVTTAFAHVVCASHLTIERAARLRQACESFRNDGVKLTDGFRHNSKIARKSPQNGPV